VTFTFSDHHLVVDAGAELGHVERAVSTPVTAEQESDDEAHDVEPWLKPLAASDGERTYRLFDVSDVYALTEDEGLSVSAWVRAGGLRVAPVTFHMAQVDNPVAASAFVDELGRRKAEAEAPNRLPGMLDYWASWMLAGFATAIGLTVWLREMRRESA
jgi:hypothetical protein